MRSYCDCKQLFQVKKNNGGGSQEGLSKEIVFYLRYKGYWVSVWWTVGREQFRQSKSICQLPDLGTSLMHSVSWQKSSESRK